MEDNNFTLTHFLSQLETVCAVVDGIAITAEPKPRPYLPFNIARMETPQPYTAAKLTLALPLSPAWSGHELDGARAALDDMLLKYNADIGAVLLAYGKLAFAGDEATAEAEDAGGPHLRSHQSGAAVAIGRMFDELPAVHVRVTMEALLFTPRLGELLTGRVNITGPGHVGCLVAGLFGAAVLGDELAGGYEFEDADGTPRWAATEKHAAAVAGAKAAGGSSAGEGTAAAVGKKRRRDEGSAGDSKPGSGRAAAPASAAALSTPSHFNRLLAANPPVLQAGALVTFRIKSISHSMGVISMHGSFADPGFREGAAGAPASGPASVAGASAGAGRAILPPSAAPAARSSAAAEAAEEEEEQEGSAAADAAQAKSGKKKERKEKKERGERSEKKARKHRGGAEAEEA